MLARARAWFYAFSLARRTRQMHIRMRVAQAAAMLTVFIVALVADLAVRPVYEPVLARAERLTLLTLVASFYGITFMAIASAPPTPAATAGISFVVIVLPVLTVGWFLLTLLRELVAVRVAGSLGYPAGSVVTSRALDTRLAPLLPRAWMRLAVRALMPSAEAEYVPPTGFELRPALCVKHEWHLSMTEAVAFSARRGMQVVASGRRLIARRTSAVQQVPPLLPSDTRFWAECPTQVPPTHLPPPPPRRCLPSTRELWTSASAVARGLWSSSP